MPGAVLLKRRWKIIIVFSGDFVPPSHHDSALRGDGVGTRRCPVVIDDTLRCPLHGYRLKLVLWDGQWRVIKACVIASVGSGMLACHRRRRPRNYRCVALSSAANLTPRRAAGRYAFALQSSSAYAWDERLIADLNVESDDTVLAGHVVLYGPIVSADNRPVRCRYCFFLFLTICLRFSCSTFTIITGRLRIMLLACGHKVFVILLSARVFH